MEAFADDVNIIMPRDKESIKEVIRILDGFEDLSGLKVNRDKTQVLRIGKGAISDPILCPELGLKWVTMCRHGLICWENGAASLRIFLRYLVDLWETTFDTHVRQTHKNKSQI